MLGEKILELIESNPPDYTVDVPLPDKRLHPNARTRNYRWRASLVHKCRGITCTMATGIVQTPMKFPAVRLMYTFNRNIRRDRDNLQAWAKSVMDGLTDAGWWNDDNCVLPLPVKIVIDKHAEEKLTVQAWK